MEQYKRDVISILRAVVCRDASAIPTEEDWNQIWGFAQKNHLEAVVYTAAPRDRKSEFEGSFYKMVSRTICQGHLLEQIEKALSDAGIHYGPQKGSILKRDYPEAYFRFMSDIDLYIDPRDRAPIREAMKSIGGVFTGTESGDEQFRFTSGFGVEFHGRLLYRKTKQGIENYPDWSLLDQEQNRLTEEGYALNLIGHAVSDLSKGGPGVRYILDLWVYRHKHQPQPDWDYVWKRLEKDGISAAAKNLLSLAEYLFSDGEETALMEEMAEYVLAGGLYGDARRSAATEIAKTGGKWRAFQRQLFRTRTEFENRYPWLKKRPYLFPVAWGLRIYDSIRRHRKEFFSWRKRIKNVSDEMVSEQRKRLKRFGL